MIATKEYRQKKRYQLRCAVCLLLLKKEKDKTFVLLQKREHTGLYDGKYDVSVCGHLEENESLMDCVIREAKEEVLVELKKEDLELLHLLHIQFEDAEYFMPLVVTTTWRGRPQIGEPNKCSALEWFAIDELPKEIIPERKQMIEDYINQISYRETGFKKESNLK